MNDFDDEEKAIVERLESYETNIDFWTEVEVLNEWMDKELENCNK